MSLVVGNGTGCPSRLPGGMLYRKVPPNTEPSLPFPLLLYLAAVDSILSSPHPPSPPFIFGPRSVALSV